MTNPQVILADAHALVRSTPKSMRRKPILEWLGLPLNTRWEKAQPVIKAKIVQARRNNDNASAAIFSQAQAFLKRTLLRTCRKCKVATKPWSHGFCGVCCSKAHMIAATVLLAATGSYAQVPVPWPTAPDAGSKGATTLSVQPSVAAVVLPPTTVTNLISWQPGGVVSLYKTTDLKTWTFITNSTSPVRVVTSSPSEYYRAKLPTGVNISLNTNGLTCDGITLDTGWQESIDGMYVYWRESTATNISTMTVGKVLAFTITNLLPGKTYEISWETFIGYKRSNCRSSTSYTVPYFKPRLMVTRQ